MRLSRQSKFRGLATAAFAWAVAGPAAADVLGEAEGPDGMLFQVTSVERGGTTLTVQGRLVNNGEDQFNPVGRMSDPRIRGVSGTVLTGMTVVDQAAGTQAGPLFTEGGSCACTSNLSIIKPGSTLPIFGRFPLPVEEATTIDVSLPGFNPIDGVPIGGDDSAAPDAAEPGATEGQGDAI